MFKSVFRFFRYDNKGDPLLDNKTFKFKELSLGVSLETKDIQTLITSNEQVGKTFLTLPVCLIYLSLGIPVVYLVMDRNQKRQVHRRLTKIMKELHSHLISQGFSKDIIARFDPDNILYYDSYHRYKEESIEQLENSLNCTNPRFMFVIKEHTQIQRINNFLTDGKRKIILVLDEVHKTGAYKKDEVTYHDDNIKYDSNIVYLKEYAQKIINISATGQDFMMVENMFSDNIVYINPGKQHTGIKDWRWDINFNTKKDKKTDIVPSSVLQFIDTRIAEGNIFRTDFKNNKKDKHPQIILCKYHRKLEDQKDMLIWFKNNSKYKELTILIYQGDGIYIYHKSFGKESISISNEDNYSQTSSVQDEVHYFNSAYKNSIGITDALQYLSERGIENHPYILIIGFDMVCEGISYCSHHNKPQNWHLTAILARFSNNTTAALQKQVISRVNGNHGDDIKPIIGVDFRIKEKILHSHEMTERQIQTCINLSQTGNVKICKDHLGSLEFFYNRVPTNHYKIKSIKTSTIPNPDSKKEKKMIKLGETSIEILYTLNPDKYELPTSLIKQKEEQHVRTDENTFYLLDPEELNMDTFQYTLADNIIKEIIDRKETDNKILRSTVLRWLLENKKFENKSLQIMKGLLDAGIIHKMKKVKFQNTRGLIYWKQNNRFFFQLNM